MLQLSGLKYISTPRPGCKRGGGAAIVVNVEKFSLEKLNIYIPHKLEVVWGLLRPKSTINQQIREIIACSLYFPPNSKKHSKMLDHIISTSHHFLTKFPSAMLVLGGDINKLNISPIISSLPRVRQIVTQNTRGDKILDVILTNFPQFYSVPVIYPPVPPDKAGQGVASDHSVPITRPLTQTTVGQVREYVTRTSRPLPESRIREFGQWITGVDWDNCIPEKVNSSEKVAAFETMLKE